jgi:hypothetical protein
MCPFARGLNCVDCNWNKVNQHPTGRHLRQKQFVSGEFWAYGQIL